MPLYFERSGIDLGMLFWYYMARAAGVVIAQSLLGRTFPQCQWIGRRLWDSAYRSLASDFYSPQAASPCWRLEALPQPSANPLALRECPAWNPASA
ncbi:MAG TPA: hypothetical protein VMW62_01120 [Chloroflexota bacterium]|nr:hypothetical protein [Chloroflexota bacterium]